MTEQLKAEAFVRSQRPAFMEKERMDTINLQDWLAALVPFAHSIHFHGNMYIRAIMEEDSDPNIVFNLTTGQPATEADYKAFNDITSVWQNN